MTSIDINSVAILNTHGVGYHCVIVEISESEAINSLKKIDLNENKLIYVAYSIK